MKATLLPLLLSLALPALAQQQNADSVWTLSRCLDYAREHNLELRQSRLAVDRSEIDVYADKGQLFPSLSFATNQSVSWRPWSKEYVNLQNGTLSTTSSEVNYNGTYGLSARWDVWDGGKTRKQVERDKVAVDRSRLETQSSECSLAEQIVQSYVQILYQQEAVAANCEILEGTRLQLRRAEQMEALGVMSRADLAQMQAQVSQEEYNVVNSRTQLATYRLNLRQLLQLTDGSEIAVVPPAQIDTLALLAPLPALADVYASAEALRPEIASSRLGLQLAKMDEEIAKRGYYPTVSMTAGINTTNASGMRDHWYEQLKTNLSNSAGLTVSVPIFDNRQTKAAVRRAKVSALESEISLETARTNLYNTVENLRLTAENASQQYRSAIVNTAAMRESYSLVSEQFALGLKDIVDLTTGKNNYIQALQQELQAKYTSLLNRSLLKYYGGEPLTL